MDNKVYWTWEQAMRDSDLESSTKLVLFVLNSYMNPEQPYCFPSIETIAKASSFSERSVVRHLDKAVNSQFIVKSKRRKDGQDWANNRYHLCFPDGTNFPTYSEIYKSVNGEGPILKDKVDTESHAKVKSASEPVSSASDSLSAKSPNSMTQSPTNIQVNNNKQNNRQEDKILQKFNLYWESDKFKKIIPSQSRGSRVKALSSVRKCLKEDSSLSIDELFIGLTNYYKQKDVLAQRKENKQKGIGDGKFIKHLTSVLNGKYYEDFLSSNQTVEVKKPKGQVLSDTRFASMLRAYEEKGTWDSFTVGPEPNNERNRKFSKLTEQQYQEYLLVAKRKR